MGTTTTSTARRVIFWQGDNVRIKDTNWSRLTGFIGRTGKISKGIKAKYWVQVTFQDGSFADFNTAHLEKVK